MTLDELFTLEPYSLSCKDKQMALQSILNEQIRKHEKNCPEYARILKALNYDTNLDHTCDEFPFVPVRLFKLFSLLSVPKDKIIKTVTSSGTTGQQVSKIFLDAQNVRDQTKTLNIILSSFFGKERLPLLLLDTALIKKDRSMYSARGAGIIGFSIFGHHTTYALDSNMNLDIDVISEFIKQHQNETILLFGFTFMIWQFVIRVLEEKGISFNIPNAVMFHIGGWKKLKDQAVSSEEFNRRVRERLGNVQVYNYYGMVEQLGSVFAECEYGHMHCSNFSEVIVRRPSDFSIANFGEKGLLELISVLPTSYPGNVILTEDEGEILGEDDCPCGRKGKYFKIHGRIKHAEIRGCSDTYEKR